MMTMTMKLSDVDLLSLDGFYPQTTAMLKVTPVLLPVIRPPLPTLRTRDPAYVLHVILMQSTAVLERIIYTFS